MPEWLVDSGWLEHAPFAFWLIDTHRPETLVELGTHCGYSYFAFCQAVKNLGLATRCFAVDTWRGDEHAGYYGEETFQKVSAYNRKQYWDFSELVRATFDEALPSFADATIDLLHIDGGHFYDDVRHDFETWIGKLSNRAIVLFHDTNVRVQDFGVYRLWGELRTQYPHFEFPHGHGLGVLGIGTDLPDAMLALFAAADQSSAKEVHRAYSRLGAAISDHVHGAAAKQELTNQLAATAVELDTLSNELRATAAERDRISSEKQTVESVASGVVAERDVLAGNLAASQVEVQCLKSKILASEQEFQRLRSEILDYKAAQERLTRDLTSVTLQLNRILSSTSWHITSPVRWTAEKLPAVKSILAPPLRFLWWTGSFQLVDQIRAIRAKKYIAESGLFDGAFYLKQNPDVRDAGLDPLKHYVSHGAGEGRDPNHLFDTDWYLTQNPDVAAARVNPLAHYIRRGWKEGRDPNPRFHTSAYLARNPNLRSSGVNPLLHYIQAAVSESLQSPSAKDQPQPASLVIRGQEEWDTYGRRHLDELLAGTSRLKFPLAAAPELSILLVFYNKAHLSLMCLESLQANADCSYEVIIIDNNSSDQTASLLERCDGATIIRNSQNAGFADACRMGATKANGKYLLFLNNDTLLQPHVFTSALQNFEDQKVGAVGGKILLANGDLQEAGSIIWSDGSAYGYGRLQKPDLPEFEFKRPVDYCSGAFLFTPTKLFGELGGFDSLYAPAYYEDADYCMKVWESGLKVLYDPRCVIRHYESASSGGNHSARPFMAANRDKFVSRWRMRLSSHYPPSMDNVIRARIATHSAGLRILYFDDRVPHRSLGSGFPRSNDIVHELTRQGHHVTCVSVAFPFEEVASEYTDIARYIELLDGTRNREKVFHEYVPSADLIWISRPHNLAFFLDKITECGELSTKVVYDAEAIFGDRDRLCVTLQHRIVPPKVLDARLEREIALARAADAVVVVSSRDQESFARQNISNVHVLSYSMAANPTSAPFRDRHTFLFIGGVHGFENPNADSIRYFCKEVWPEVHQRTKAELVVGGFGTDRFLADIKQAGVRIAGLIGDLTSAYNEARVFVAPTRYSAGIPLKVHGAAAAGVPAVVSQLIGEQLQWENGREVLIAQNAEAFISLCCKLYTHESLWHDIRQHALSRVKLELDPKRFADKVSAVLTSVALPNQEPSEVAAR